MRVPRCHQAKRPLLCDERSEHLAASDGTAGERCPGCITKGGEHGWLKRDIVRQRRVVSTIGWGRYIGERVREALW